MYPITPILAATIAAERRREAQTAMRARLARRPQPVRWRRSQPGRAAAPTVQCSR